MTLEEQYMGRALHQVNGRLLSDFVGDRAVAVTGAGGSIGSELCRRLLAHGATRVLAIDNHEPSLHQLSEETEGLAIRLGDVRDGRRLRDLFMGFRPDVVFHAAALKQVPLLQSEWTEAVKTNVLGASKVLETAHLSGATRCILISTDKAVAPVSVLGITKRMAELLFTAHDIGVVVRFGNVLGTVGSVVPKFEKQIAARVPITVTHPEMKRYMMTVTEACDLAMAAATFEPNGSVYVLVMGDQVKIVDLANRMVKWLTGGFDRSIIYTGVRPGERLSECLFTRDEMRTMVDTEIQYVMRCTSRGEFSLAELDEAVSDNNRDAFMALLRAK